MRISKTSAAVLVASACLLAVRSADVKEYAGEEFAAGNGLVVMRVIRQTSESSSNNLSVTREYKDLMGVIDSTDGKQRFVVGDVNTVRAFVLPAGRYYLAEIRTPRDRNLPKISDKKNAVTRSFEVVAGAINYAGVYSVQFVLDSEGRQSVNVNIEYGPEMMQEAAAAFPTAFAALPLLYCPVGRKCKPAAELQ